ncbi:MAG TPA: hypothetical protein VIM49_11605, partial [Dermatophilaceae bacterium]
PTPQKKGERKNKPRRADSSRAERVKTLTQFQSTKEKPGQPSNPKATKQTEIKLGIDFWHAVEFSRIGRTPTRRLTTTHRGNRSNLPDPQGPVKPTRIRRSRVVEQGLA